MNLNLYFFWFLRISLLIILTLFVTKKQKLMNMIYSRSMGLPKFLSLESRNNTENLFSAPEAETIPKIGRPSYFIKNDISQYCKHIKTESDYILWISIDNCFIDIGESVILGTILFCLLTRNLSKAAITKMKQQPTIHFVEQNNEKNVYYLESTRGPLGLEPYALPWGHREHLEIVQFIDNYCWSSYNNWQLRNLEAFDFLNIITYNAQIFLLP